MELAGGFETCSQSPPHALGNGVILASAAGDFRPIVVAFPKHWVVVGWLMKSVNISTGWPRRTMLVAGGCCSLLGLVGLFEWYSANEVLRYVISALSPMQPNTALSFWLCGMGLLAMVRGWRCLSAMSGVAVAAISLLTFIQYMFTVDVGIDQFFIAIESTRQPGYPGRMAPPPPCASR
jgi:hypothetical protein